MRRQAFVARPNSLAAIQTQFIENGVEGRQSGARALAREGFLT